MQLRQCVQRGPVILVWVHATRGSVPREQGAWMAVHPEGSIDTIGGGRLELDAIAHARGLLRGEPLPALVRYALGPSLGQCCGGEVHLRFERWTAHDMAAREHELVSPAMPVAVFGGGHVGQALTRILAGLPMQVCWIDSREAIFPQDTAAQVQCEHSEPVQAAVAHLPAQSRVVVMSFSHAEDLDIVAACLLRLRQQNDLPFVGLIGSKTKWASFRSRLQARGFSDAEMARITCPIGVAGIHDKRPEVIAVAVAAQLLQTADLGLH